MAVVPTALPARDTTADSSAATSPQRLLFALWALFCLIMILVAVQDEWDSHNVDWWEPLLWEGSSCSVATVWVWLQRRGRQRFADDLNRPLRWFGRHLLWLPLLTVTFIAAVYGIRHGVYALLGLQYRHPPWLFVLGYESLKLWLYVGLWMGIIFGFDAFEAWQAQRRHVLELQKTLAEAQLSQLKAQLRPHFFFNALNTISALMHVDVQRADRLLARLGDLLRTSLQAGNEETIPLQEELRTLELFAQIMQERFSDRVALTWDIDAEALPAKVPAMLLQPLLENAFKHGVEQSVGSVKIEIAAHRLGSDLAVTVRNSGSTLAPDYREGVGLRNCRERLRVIYGEAASLDLSSSQDAVIATIHWPASAAS